jgi:aminoglycoside 2'-N-acetyltransferase I
MTATNASIRQLATGALTDAESAAIRALLRDAFAGDGEGFTDEDWEHALGGVHFLLEEAGSVIAHAAVVQRELHVDGRPIRAGYVEAVATRRDRQRQGHGTQLMEAVHEHIRTTYQFGALSAASPAFYARLGWQPWLGPTAVRIPSGEVRTPDDDGAIMVLTTPSSPPIDRRGVLSCAWRSGDVW